MPLKDLTTRIALLMLLGWAITILCIQAVVALWRHDRVGILYLALGAGLTLVFFRKRIVALAIVALTFVLVNAGLTAVFHPTIAGILLTVGSVSALFVIVRWHRRKYPNLAGKDWQRIFD